MASEEHDIPEQSEDVGLLHGHHASTSYLLDDKSGRDKAAPSASYSPGYRDSIPIGDKGYDYFASGPGVQSLNDKPYDSDPSSYELVTRDKEDEDFEFRAMDPRSKPVSTRPHALARYFGFYPLEQRIEDKRRGIGVQRHPYVVWVLTIVMLGVLIYELVLNARNQGNPFSFKPVVNPMLGPSQSAIIYSGARFPPCMKEVQDLLPSTLIPCMNDTANPPDRLCPLEDICGFGGFHNEEPNQWFRFITPVFLHAGIIHYALNMLAQLTSSAQIEREMGSIGFLVLYFAAGIFGNILGGNFSLVGAPSVGASGAIFGTVAVTWVDLFAHWRYQYRPGRKLCFMLVELILGIGIGYIPYVDNFAHLGGLLMGLLVGMVLYPIISPSTRHRTIVWALRLAAIPAAILLFVFLTRNFYTSNPYAACSWCRYLSCIPTSGNNHCRGTGFETTSTTSV